LSIVLSVILWLFILCAIAAAAFFIIRTARPFSHTGPRTSGGDAAPYAPLYSLYRTPRWYFFGILISAILLRSLFIAIVTSGKVQVILILVLEVLLFIATVVLRPHHTRGGDVFASYLSVCRVVAAGLMIAFIESLQVKAIPRVVSAVSLDVYVLSDMKSLFNRSSASSLHFCSAYLSLSCSSTSVAILVSFASSGVAVRTT
jgi:hypothetical protein